MKELNLQGSRFNRALACGLMPEARVPDAFVTGSDFVPTDAVSRMSLPKYEMLFMGVLVAGLKGI